MCISWSFLGLIAWRGIDSEYFTDPRNKETTHTQAPLEQQQNVLEVKVLFCFVLVLRQGEKGRFDEMIRQSESSALPYLFCTKVKKQQ